MIPLALDEIEAVASGRLDRAPWASEVTGVQVDSRRIADGDHHPLHEGAGHAEIQEARDTIAELVEPLHLQGPCHAVGGAERVDEHGHVVALDAFEEDCDITIGGALRDAVHDLGDLEIA